MFAFFTDWGNGERALFLVPVVIYLPFLVGYTKKRKRNEPQNGFGLFYGLIFVAIGLIASMGSENGRRDTKEARTALEQYEWEVLDAGHSPQVQIGDCIVDLRRVKLDGSKSLFAIGNEPDAHPLSEIFPEVVELCSTG